MNGRRRMGAPAWIGAGLAFAAYPAVRPSGDSGADWATTAWLVGHLLAVAGFGLLVAGLGALWSAVRDGPGERLGFAAVVTGGVGAVLVLPYYGAEVFALHVLGSQGAPATLGDQIRFLPAAATTFATGLAALAVASVLAALAVHRSRVLPAWTGWLLATGWVLYLPQFFAPYELRVVHGVLVAAGCLAVAWYLRTVRSTGRTTPAERAVAA
ncbi:hypothetical protein [Pseudonocardia endophytica]|uniref:Uncharacterized protein n=1 Tax=Pseudonocardia endophytica TaxID=401976 RepID=A0A4R1HVX0_PSEEN|nr:hypothetical protein [Pseudonocardia endophytica]TCK26894.1 hypothetical protein EV378_2739 [Pseudonocardia endophytica]